MKKDAPIPDGKSARLQRSMKRRARMVTHRATSFDDAEQWDLAYWQSKTPQERLSALVAIREDVLKVEDARRKYENTNKLKTNHHRRGEKTVCN